MRNSAIIKSIKVLLNALKTLDDISGLRYLLGQTIRQYDVPQENHHVSIAANNLWNKLSQKPINDFHYRDIVKCDNLNTEETVNTYKGSSREVTKRVLKQNDQFVFRDLFHEDHVIPVSFILKDLINLSIIDEESIKQCLEKMHICVLLKEEDRKIGRTRNRDNDYDQIICNVYNKAGIQLK